VTDEAVAVTVLPREVMVRVRPGQSIYEAAVQSEIRWPTTCEGSGTCHLCVMSVIEGAEDLAPPEPLEAEGLAEVVDNIQRGPLRLACQVRPTRDLVVFKRGVRPSS
jgi:adenylate cyclase